jgi:general secretion pathway protein D
VPSPNREERRREGTGPGARITRARAEAAIESRRESLQRRDYETAVAQYKLACDLVSPSEYTRVLYDRALDGFCNASIKLAEQRISEAVMQTRRTPETGPHRILQAELSSRSCPPAPSRDTGILQSHHWSGLPGKVEEVKKLLLEAQGFFDSARYDLAFKRCEQVLNLDNYNIAARKMEEQDQQGARQLRARLLC